MRPQGEVTIVLAVVLMVFYIAAIAAAGVLLVLVLRARRLTPANVGLAIYLIMTAMWSAIAIDVVLRQPAEGVLTTVWITVVVSFLMVAIRILGHAVSDAAWRPTWKFVLGLLVHPTVMVIIAIFPSMHGLIVGVDGRGLSYYAVGYWVHAGVSYVFSMHSGWLLVRARHQVQALVGYSRSVVLLPWVLPIVANSFSVWQHGPMGFDFTPLAFLASSVVIGRAITQEGLASVMPIARLRVFESLKDAVVVLDPAGRFVDANARALALMGRSGSASSLAGRTLKEVCGPIAAIASVDGEYDVNLDGKSMVIHVDRSPLTDPRGREVGRLVHLRDITVDMLQRRDLAEVSDALAREAMINESLRAELAEQVIRDADTGLHNRRFIFAELPIIAAGCARDEVPLSIVLLDVDRFKAVNDTYGHSAGDRTLEAVAVALESAADGALVARFGGEEFMVLLPGVTTDEAVLRAEALLAACASIAVPTREGPIGITVSAGVATALPGSIDFAALIERADGALYEAKDGGRNRVCSSATGAVRHPPQTKLFLTT